MGEKRPARIRRLVQRKVFFFLFRFFQICKFFRKYLKNFEPLKQYGEIREPIYIACASDENFVTPLTVMLKSLSATLENRRKVVVFVLNRSLGDISKNRIIKLIKSEQIDITFIDLDNFNLKDVIISGHITEASYYRLFLALLLPKDLKKVIYLDSDLLIDADIGMLWDMDMKGKHILAATNQSARLKYVSSPNSSVNYKALGINSNAKYFNAGVMVIDLEKWRKDASTQKCIDYLEHNKDYIRYWDQDVLNAVLFDKWGELDPRWNLQYTLFKNHSWKEGPVKNIKDFLKLVYCPYIIHFNTYIKPWQQKSSQPYKKLFLHYLSMVNEEGLLSLPQ